MKLLQKTRWEVRRHFVLRVFIALISAMFLLQWYEWIDQFDLILNDIEYGKGVPWPLGSEWEYFVSQFLYSNFSILKYAGITTAAIAILLTFNTHTYIAGFFVAFIAFVVMQIFFFCDYRLGSQLHHLISLLGVIFFFLPNKRKSLKAGVFLVLLASGLYQLNSNMLSGQAFSLNWVLNLHIPYLILYLLFRITAPFLLFSKVRYLRYFGAISLVGCFIVELNTVSSGPFLLSLLLCILFLFLDKKEKERVDTRYQSYILPDPHPVWPYFFSFVYLCLQGSYLFVPPSFPDPIRFFFTMHSQPKVISCATAIVTYSPNRSELIQSHIGIPENKRCDLVEIYQTVKSQCRTQLSGDNAKVQIIHSSKYLSGPFLDQETELTVKDTNFCEKFLQSSFLEVTQWIQVRQSKSKYL